MNLLNKKAIKFIFASISINVAYFTPSYSLAQTEPQSTSQEKSIGLNVESLDTAWKHRAETQTQQKMLQLIEECIDENIKPSSDFEIKWRLARFVYFIGNFGIEKTLTNKKKVEIFEYGYKILENAKDENKNRVEGYYWFASNLGSYGLAKGILSALVNAKKGRDALLVAAEIDKNYMWGGAYRILGRYFQEVPSFSFGDKKTAEKYFNEAIKVAPDFRLNTMYLGVLKKENGDKTEAMDLFSKAQKKPMTDGKIEEEKYLIELAKDIKEIEED